MGWRRALSVLAVAAAAGTGAGTASASTPPPGFMDAGVAHDPASDGVRWAALARGDGVIAVDSRTGHAERFSAPCRPSAFGTRELLLTCAGNPDGQPPGVFDLRAPAFSTIGPVAKRIESKDRGAAAGLTARYTDIGRYWVRATTSTYHDATWDDLYRRADGRELSTDAIGARRLPDPDARSGSVPLCRPLHRRPGPKGFDRQPKYARYQFEKPYGLTTDAKGLVLERCGSRAIRLSRNPQVYSEQIGGRFVTWAEAPDTIHFYDIRARRAQIFRYEGADARYLTVAHTRVQIIVEDQLVPLPDRHVYVGLTGQPGG
jgi:hypothetical protein